MGTIRAFLSQIVSISREPPHYCGVRSLKSFVWHCWRVTVSSYRGSDSIFSLREIRGVAAGLPTVYCAVYFSRFQNLLPTRTTINLESCNCASCRKLCDEKIFKMITFAIIQILCKFSLSRMFFCSVGQPVRSEAPICEEVWRPGCKGSTANRLPFAVQRQRFGKFQLFTKWS